MLSKKKSVNVLFSLVLCFYCAPLFALSAEDTCLKDHTNFFSRYFSTHSSSVQIVRVAECIDDIIQLFLNHTTTGNPKYYTQVELRRFMQYMGYRKSQANKMSKAFLNLKVGFIGGEHDKLTVKEIDLSRKIILTLAKRMKAMSTGVPTLVRTINGEPVTINALISSSNMLKNNLTYLGESLALSSFSLNLLALKKLPENLNTLGFTHINLNYWKPALLWIRQWKKIFFSKPDYIIHSTDLPLIFNSFGQITEMWFFHKRFLKNQFWLNPKVIQYTQHFLSYSLNVLRDAQKQAGGKALLLSDLDKLAERTWFLPTVHTTAFRLSLRSVYCFLLNPLAEKKTCRYSATAKNQGWTLRFSDLVFTISSDSKKITESPLSTLSDRIRVSHLEVLRKHLNEWIGVENYIRGNSAFPRILFGAPDHLLNRRVNITSNSQMVFYTNTKNRGPFLSHLNWQSHLLKWVVSAYTTRANKEVDQELWKTMIKEWTAVSFALYPDMQWQSFQKTGTGMFHHGDYLLSVSNADGILQSKELLELFSLFVSSASMGLSFLNTNAQCKTSTYYLNAECVYHYLSDFPSPVFVGFPRLQKNLSPEQQSSYLSLISSIYKEETLSFKNLFEIFLFIHYQENLMEHIDRDSSQKLDVYELEWVLNVFEDFVIEEMPLVYTKKQAFGFITYFFHYGEVPIFSEKNPISAPVHFSNWLIQPKKWKDLQVGREDILRVLFSMNQYLK